MIAASDPQEFVPSGRQQALKHPGPRDLPTKKSYGHNEDILDKFEKVSLKEKEFEWWILRKTPFEQANTWLVNVIDEKTSENRSIFKHKSFDHASKQISNSYSKDSFEDECTNRVKNDYVCFHAKSEVNFVEDELYVKGNTVIWSRGIDSCDSLNACRKTICAYTSTLPIKHAIWCTFYCEHPTYETEVFPLTDKEQGTEIPVPGICMVDANNIHVFTQKGEDFVIAAPFQIRKIWSMKYGVFFEKEFEDHNFSFYESKATLYSLAFPLDEVCPVAVNAGSNIQIFNNNNLKLLFTNENPSICLVYDTQIKQHTVYFIRKVTSQEKIELLNKINSTCHSAVSLSNKLKSRLSMWDCVNNSNQLNIPSVSSRPGSVGSFQNQIHSRSYGSMATVSRCQSPATSSIGSPWLQRASRLNQSIPCGGTNYMQSTGSFFDNSKVISHFQTNPIVCLDQIWTDSNFTQDDALNCSASKVFLCDDFTNQWYLCYILPSRCQLQLLQIDFSTSTNITTGSLSNINAKDAVPIPKLHMLAVLEHNGNVNLFSGVTLVGKLHIGGTLVQHTPSPYIRRNFTSPFPRRSSLLPHCKQADLKFDEHLLSPVLPENINASRTNNILQLNFQLEGNLPKAVLNGLRDPIENRITLRYSDGTYYRINLPPLTAHPLIENCIIALNQCLSKELILVVLTKWYATRNAFGSRDMNLENEWKLFETLLLELLGYEHQDIRAEECPTTPLSNPKKLKHSSSGNDDDWLYLLNSVHEAKLGNYLKQKLKLKSASRDQQKDSSITVQINVKSVLFPYVKLIHYCLHLLYEDLKLNVLRSEDLKLLGILLNKLSCDLDLIEYSVHYWKDFPNSCEIRSTKVIGESEVKLIYDFSSISEKPPNIMQFIYNLLMQNCNDNEDYPFVRNINTKSKDIIQICGIILKDLNINANMLVRVLDSNFSSSEFITVDIGEKSTVEEAILLMTSKGITVRDLDTLPPAIYMLFYSTLWKCRKDPPPDFPIEAYYLLWREDLAAEAEKVKNDRTKVYNNESNSQLNGIVLGAKSTENDQPDGMEDVENPLIKLRFPDDMRVTEARKMLQSSKPVPIVLVQRPDVSDHDFIEEQEKHLYAICTRTMALSPGRGMFTLRTSTPVVTEPLQTPQLCLTGKAPPRGTTVELNHIDTPSTMTWWPLFHNGVANGLRITSDANNIDNTWIIFNKPKGSMEQQMEHAGFLMALGLNGHLKNLECLNTFDYLAKLHEMTSIGILLGLSAAYRGTSDRNMTKILSVHVEALLPPTSMELDVHQNVQVAALLGIGLVYQGSSHRHIIEVLLSEIGRPPGPEMENSVDRESYSLAAGLSLGLVTLKQGSCSLGLSDLNISDRLHYYMVGGNRRPLTGAQRDKYKVPSFQIREGSSVNLDVTAPGATIALGLMYLGTGNKAVADWMAPPQTQYLLDFVRPDFLMFRILARALILWDDIKPSKEWVENQVPSTIRPYCMIKPLPNSDIDYEAMNQAYCNIITGACFALGLKFAGSADEDAFQTLLHFCHMFTNLTIKSLADLAGKPTVETCLNVLLLSVSMVMAGTGNLDIMRLVRLLRRRVGVASSSIVTYGSHLALHMALGLLFLGGGRYTLSNSPANVAALICAFYPKFPTHSNDNRYHLQAFRHLYVLAVEPRLLIPRDVHTGNSCYASLTVVKLDGTKHFVKGPGIIPALNTLQQVSVDDERYWPVVFKKGLNWDTLVAILSTNGFIEVKQRAGCLSYIVDKLGYHSQLAKTLTESELMPWDPSPSSIVSFTHDDAIKFFCDHFLPIEDQQSIKELQIKQILTRITYDAVVKDKLVIVPVISFLLKAAQEMKNMSSAVNLWQIKTIFAQTLSTSLSCDLVPSEIMLAMEQQITSTLENWEETLFHPLLSYLNGNLTILDAKTRNKLAAYILYYDIPFKQNFRKADLFENILERRDKVSIRTMDKIIKIRNCNSHSM